EAVTLLLERAQTAEIQVRERAGVVGFCRFDQGDVDRRVATLDVLRRRGAAETAADYNDLASCAGGVARCHHQECAGRGGLAHVRQPLATGEIDVTHCLLTSALGDLATWEK